MMKANNQLGFININEDSIDKIIKDDEVIFERGFLREKTSTTLPITFGSVGKDLKNYKIYGNTYQNSTSGKNFTYIEPRTSNGITSFYDKETGKISFSGTPTQQWIGIENKHAVSIPVGTYTLSLKESKSFRIIVRYYTDDTNYEEISISANRKSVTKTFSNNIIATQIWIQLVVGTTYDEEFYLQLEEGSQATEFEPYTGGQPSPNPDYPQEIISCGDRTGNLLNVSSIETGTKNGVTCSYNNKTQEITFNGTCTADNTRFAILNNSIPFTLGNTNICAYLVNNGNNSGNGLFRVFADNYSTYDYLNLTLLNDATRIISKKTASTITKTIFDFRFDNGAVLDNFTVKLMITDSENTPYEPYGYKIPVNVRSDNLFDKDNANILNGYLTGSATSGNLVLTSSGSNRVFYIKCKPNRTYTIQKEIIDENRFRVGTTENIPSVSQSVMNYQNNDNVNFITFTTNSNSNYLIVHFYNTASNVTLQDALNTIQIIEGSTAPSKYIPYYNETTNIYLDEPLRRIEDYFDYIDFINGKVVRQLSEVVLDGDEDISRSSARNNKYRFVVGIDNINMIAISGSGEGNPILSDKYISKNRNQTYANETGIGYGNGTSTYKNLIIYDENLSSFTIEQFKTWLQSNNVTVDYVLATPTEESITLPNIPTIDGNNTLNIETEITPSQVYIKYKSNA